MSDKVDKAAGGCAELPPLLVRRNARLKLDADTDRLQTARSADQLCVSLRGRSGVEQVRALAHYEPKSGGAAVGQQVGRVDGLVDLLRDDILFGVFDQLTARRGEAPGAEELLEQVVAALRQDEVIVGLGERLRDLARQAQRLLHVEEKGPRHEIVLQQRLQALGSAAIRSKLHQLVADVEKALGSGDQELELTVNVVVTKRS